MSIMSNVEKSVREQLADMARRRYDIEQKRLISLLGEDEGQKLVDSMARRWLGVASK